jgi:hypothetical protein
MASIADEVVEGFNEFLAAQRRSGGEARVTLAQFDDRDPFEVLVDGVPLREVIDLERSRYAPRGATPLYDAVGQMISRIEAGIARRRELGAEEEDQVVLIVTDGLENASREHARRSVFRMVTEWQERGWVFAFLGADQDSYAEGGELGVAPGNRADWDKTAAGSAKLWRDASYSTTRHRDKSAEQRHLDSRHFYEEDPDNPAES